MKIKKKNLFFLILCVICVLLTYVYIQIQPIFQIQIKTYFHEKVIDEIMNGVSKIEVPQNFIIKTENHMSVDTNQLNQWIIEVNMLLNDSIDDEYLASIPLGYLSGNVFFQNVGPNLSASFLMANRIRTQYDIKTTTLGINNVLIELILNVECEGDVLLGFDRRTLMIQESIPLAVEYVQGEVPQIFPY